jgi:hypothetical protein
MPAELRSLSEFATRVQARAAVAGWIEDYNTVRRQSALGLRSPAAYGESLRERTARDPRQPGAGKRRRRPSRRSFLGAAPHKQAKQVFE